MNEPSGDNAGGILLCSPSIYHKQDTRRQICMMIGGVETSVVRRRSSSRGSCSFYHQPWRLRQRRRHQRHHHDNNESSSVPAIPSCRFHYRLRLPSLHIGIIISMSLIFSSLLILSNFIGQVAVAEAWTTTTITARRRIQQQQQQQGFTSVISFVTTAATTGSLARFHSHRAMMSAVEASSSSSQQSLQQQQQQQPKLRSLFPSWTNDNHPGIYLVNGTIDVMGRSEQQHVLFYKVFYGANYNLKIQQQQLREAEGRGKDVQNNANFDTLKTALFLHGGPGAGCTDNHARFFDATKWDVVVLFDQRGCGKSYVKSQEKNSDNYNPLKDNTLMDLIEDCELVRNHLGFNSWTTILGGSWGTTLALGYAQTHPSVMKSLILRGMCTMRQSEIDWLFTAPQSQPREQDGKNHDDCISQRQKMWEEFEKGSHGAIDQNVDDYDPRRALRLYHQLFTTAGSTTKEQQQTAARSWFQWEMFMSVFHKLQSSHDGTATKSSAAVDTDNARTTNMRQQMLNWDQDIELKLNRSDPSVGVATIVRKRNRVDKVSQNQDQNDDDRIATICDAWTLQDSQRRRYSDASSLEVADCVERLRQGITTARMPDPTSTTTLIYDELQSSAFDTSPDLSRQVLLTCHYSYYRDHCMNGVELLDNTRMKRLADPTSTIENIIIIQGGMDNICPPDTALDFLQAWINVEENDGQSTWSSSQQRLQQQTLELRIPLKSGHSMYDPFITHELVDATDRVVAVTTSVPST